MDQQNTTLLLSIGGMVSILWFSLTQDSFGNVIAEKKLEFSSSSSFEKLDIWRWWLKKEDRMQQTGAAAKEFYSYIPFAINLNWSIFSYAPWNVLTNLTQEVYF